MNARVNSDLGRPDASAAPAIARKPRADEPPDAAGFEALRARGIEAIQHAAGRRWTDHNLHDPGITILEQLCYALTELVYRIDLPVADHLCRDDGSIDFNGQALFKPQEIFPCRAGTGNDYRRLLLDRVPQIDDLSLSTLAPDRPGLPSVGGLHHLQIQLAADLGSTSEAECVQLALAEYRAQRSFGEDIDDAVSVVERVPCTLHAMVEIEGHRHPASLLAEVYDRAARFLAGRVRSRSLGEQLNLGRSLSEIFTGPEPQHGFIDEADAAAARPARLFVSDLGRELQGIDGVREVSFLALQMPGQEPGIRSLPWRGEGWALSLLAPGQPGYRPQVSLLRRGSLVAIEPREVQAEYEARRSAGGARSGAPGDFEKLLPMPTGVHLEPQPYYSVQNQFPAVYGLGPEGLPADAGTERRAQARQLQAYLLLAEQVMAHSGAQLDHLAELFSRRRRAGRVQSRWWALIDEASVPGVGELYIDEPARIVEQVCVPRDDAYARRHRVLDYLLALYGQTFAQNTLRQFLGHLERDELEAQLLDNKFAFLGQTVTLSRNRAGGFDPGSATWDAPDNTSGLQRSVSLLLGWRRPVARALAQPLRSRGCEPLGDAEMQRAGLQPQPFAADAAGLPRSGEAAALQPRYGDAAASQPTPDATALQPVADAAALQPLAPSQPAKPGESGRDEPAWLRRVFPRLPERLVQAGILRRRYRCRPLGGGPRAELLLAADADGAAWWSLGVFDDATAATREADALRRWLLGVDRDGEGLHVIEHVLLRPRAAEGPHRELKLSPDFYTLRASVVFAGWTARGSDPAFREFANETVQINAPAHVAVQCLWFGFAAMLDLEAALETWLEALRQFSAAQRGCSAEQLDSAACELIRALQRRPQRGA